MQGDIDARKSGLEISILGVNRKDAASGNSGATAGRTIPWLQDTEEASVWDSWEINYRDVLILDAENHPVAVYNLSQHNLADSTSYDSLLTLLLEWSDTTVVVDTLPVVDTTAVGDTTAATL